MKNILTALLFILLIANNSFGQTYSEQGLEKSDSLKNLEYPYILPIYGAAAHKLGYKLPYSAGIGINYLAQESDLIIDNLQVGFNNGPMTNLDEIIRFDGAIAGASGINVRPDIWLFPFLNVYALVAQAKTSTEISAGLYLPDTSNNWNEVTAFSTKAKFDATTFGFGLTPTFAVKGWWVALDMNMAWTDVSALDKPVFTFVFGPRMGKTFKIDEDMNLSFWFGGFRLKFTSETSGSINLSELFDTNELQAKVDQGIIRVDEAQTNVDSWWGSLTPIEQQNPVNKAKFETANRTIDAAGNLLTSVDGALSNSQNATIQYSLDKRVKDMWNMVIGTQFQLNKHWMIRAEYGFLGSRNQFLGGLQYRFGL
jgi:opacity protein-like surface antigen